MLLLLCYGIVQSTFGFSSTEFYQSTVGNKSVKKGLMLTLFQGNLVKPVPTATAILGFDFDARLAHSPF